MRKAFVGHSSLIAFAAATDLAGSTPITTLFGEPADEDLARWSGDGGPSHDFDDMPQQAQQQQGHAGGQQKEMDLGDTFNFDGPTVQGDEGPVHTQPEAPEGHDYLHDEIAAVDE